MQIRKLFGRLGAHQAKKWIRTMENSSDVAVLEYKVVRGKKGGFACFINGNDYPEYNVSHLWEHMLHVCTLHQELFKENAFPPSQLLGQAGQHVALPAPSNFAPQQHVFDRPQSQRQQPQHHQPPPIPDGEPADERMPNIAQQQHGPNGVLDTLAQRLRDPAFAGRASALALFGLYAAALAARTLLAPFGA